MAEETSPLEVDFPKRVVGRWGRFSGADWQFFTFCLICLLAANHYAGKGVGLLTLILAACLMAPADYGRVYNWLGQQVSIAWLKWRRQQLIWSAQERRRLPQPEPIGLAVSAIDNLGLLHTAGNMDAVVVAAHGSNLASLELGSQYDAHLALADIIRKIAAVHEARGSNVGWGWVYRTRPLNVDSLHTQWGDYLHRQALEPSALKKPEPSWSAQDRRWISYGQNIQQLLDVTYDYSRQVTMAAVCTVPRHGFDQELTEEAIRRLPIVQTAQILASELAGAGVVDPRPLSPAQMHGYLRGGWDIKHISDYYEWQLGSSEAEILASDRLHPQESIKAGDDFLLIDGTYTSVIWIKGFNGRILPFKLRQLFDIDVPFLSVALIGSTRSSGLEYAWLDRLTAISEEIDRLGGVIHKGPKAMDKIESRLSRQRKIYESRYSQDFNVLVAVHHVNRDGLETAVDAAQQQIRLANFVGQRVTGNIRQLPFALSATTGVDFAHL